jgi:hypothetical protein
MTGADDAEGDLAAVGDEDARKNHQSSAISRQHFRQQGSGRRAARPREPHKLTADD